MVYIGFSDDLVTTGEFAKRAGVTRQGIHWLWKNGKIGFDPVTKISGGWVWKASDVDDWIDRHQGREIS